MVSQIYKLLNKMGKVNVFLWQALVIAVCSHVSAADFPSHSQDLGSGCEQKELVTFQSAVADCVLAVTPNTAPFNNDPRMVMMNILGYGICLANALLNRPSPKLPTLPQNMMIGRKKRDAAKSGKPETVAGVTVYLCCTHCVQLWVKEQHSNSHCGAEHFSSCFVQCLKTPKNPAKKFPPTQACDSLDYEDPDDCTKKCKDSLTPPKDIKEKMMNILLYATCFEKCSTGKGGRKKRYLMTNVYGAPQSVEAHTLAEYTMCSNGCQMNWLMRTFYAPASVDDCYRLPQMDYLFCYWNCILDTRTERPASYSWSRNSPDLRIKQDNISQTIISRVEYIDCYSDCLLFHNLDYDTVDRTAYPHSGSCVVEDFARSGKCMSKCLYGPKVTRNINNYNSTKISTYDKLTVTDCASSCWLMANAKEWCLVEELLKIHQCVNDCVKPPPGPQIPEVPVMLPANNMMAPIG